MERKYLSTYCDFLAIISPVLPTDHKLPVTRRLVGSVSKRVVPNSKAFLEPLFAKNDTSNHEKMLTGMVW